MPSRKSTVSVVTNGEGEDDTPAPSTSNKPPRESFGVEDLSLPRTMISRLAKGVLPANTSIQKDALLALSKSATVFVNFLASNAGEIASGNGKKTIMPNDVYMALKDHEFASFLPRVEAEVRKYNDIQCDKRNSYRRKVKEEKAAAGPATSTTEGAEDSMLSGDPPATNGGAMDDEGERPAKKIRREPGDEVDDEDDVGADEEMEDEVEDDEAGDDDEEEEDEAEDDEQAAEGVTEYDEMDHDRVGDVVDEALDEHDSD